MLRQLPIALLKCGLLSLVLLISACTEDDSYEEPPVTVDPTDDDPVDDGNTGGQNETLVVFNPTEVPYQNLSDYNFFQGDISNLTPQDDVLPYDLQSPLFSDYAKKKRFIWMPSGVSANYTSDTSLLNFPNGTVLIKNFSYSNVQPSISTKIIETRIMYKLNNTWKFAEYVWNEAQTNATLDMDGSFTDITWVNDANETQSVNYRIPSEGECFTCHKKNDQPIPIGLKPQNINKTYSYSDGDMNQLEKLQFQGYLESYPSTIQTVVKWDDTSADITERVRAYIDINCAHCHAEGSHCDYRPMRFAYNETSISENLGICVTPDENIGDQFTHIIASGNAARSVLYERISSTDEAIRMPLLGRTVNHEEGAALIQEWINSLEPSCN
jgi:uncharacterized repeat protein (TIGR03806 family)